MSTLLERLALFAGPFFDSATPLDDEIRMSHSIRRI